MSAVLLTTAAATAFAQPGWGILRMDGDGDGKVSREEFQPPQKPRGRGPMAAADANDDGAVSRAEMEAALETAIAERTELMRERMTSRFDAMDADGDGVVTAEEVAGQAFDRMDRDGDGFISEDEAGPKRGRWDGSRKGMRGGPGGPDGADGYPGRGGRGGPCDRGWRR